MTEVFTFRIEAEDSDKIKFLWDLMKAPKDGVHVTAVSSGDLFALEYAIDRFFNKALGRNFNKMTNWYSGKEVDTAEYEDLEEMLECFNSNTNWHTERDAAKLWKQLKEGVTDDGDI